MPQASFAPILEARFFRSLITPLASGGFSFPQFPFAAQPEATYRFSQSTNAENVRMSFVIENYGFMYPAFGFMNLIMHNVNRDGPLGFTRNTQSGNQNTIDAENPYVVGVELYAGYETDPELTLIYQGVATEVLDSFIQPNNQLRFYCQFCPNNTTKNFKFTADTTLFEAITQVINAFRATGECPVNSISISNFHPPDLSTATLRLRTGTGKPYPLSGTFSDVIYHLASRFKVDIKVSSTSISVHDVDNNKTAFVPSYLNNDALIVNYENGLIGSPTFFWQSGQVSFQMVLNPRINFSTLFVMQNVGGTIQGPTNSIIQVANNRIRDAICFPKLFTHRGDTRGSDWYTEVTAYVANTLFDSPSVNATDRLIPNFPNIINC